MTAAKNPTYFQTDNENHYVVNSKRGLDAAFKHWNKNRGWSVPDLAITTYPALVLFGDNFHECMAAHISISDLNQLMLHPKMAPRSKVGFTFDDALRHMQIGKLVQRSGWNGKGMSVRIVPGNHDLNAHMRLRNPNGSESTWVPSSSDCLAHDWHVVGDSA